MRCESVLAIVAASGARLLQLLVERLRSSLRELVLPAPPDLGRDGRSQVEVRERGAQVQAGAADHDRPPAGREQLVDLAVGELGVPAGAERGVDGQDRQQPVLEPLLLGGRGGAGQGLQAAVDLQRVGRHRHRVLSVGAEPVRQGDRDGGLADAGRPEQRDDRGRRRHGRGVSS